MAVYLSDNKLIYTTYSFYRGQLIRTTKDISWCINEAMHVTYNRLHYIIDDKLYELMDDITALKFQNKNLIGTRQFVIISRRVLVTITENYTIRKFNLKENTYQDFGEPNPNINPDCQPPRKINFEYIPPQCGTKSARN